MEHVIKIHGLSLPTFIHTKPSHITMTLDLTLAGINALMAVMV